MVWLWNAVVFALVHSIHVIYQKINMWIIFNMNHLINNSPYTFLEVLSRHHG